MQEIVGIAAEAPGAAVGRLQFGRLGQIGLLIQSLCQNLLDAKTDGKNLRGSGEHLRNQQLRTLVDGRVGENWFR
jgi:hypothetical protein